MNYQQSTETVLKIGDNGRSSVVVGWIVGSIGILTPLASLIQSISFSDDFPWWAIGLIGLAVIIIGGAVLFTAKAKWLILRKTGTSELVRKKSLEAKQGHIPS